MFDAFGRPSFPYYSDIALLELRNPFKSTCFVMPVCLDHSRNSQFKPKLGDWCGVASFGRNDKNKPNKILQTLEVDASTLDWDNEHLFNADNICHGHLNGEYLAY